LQARAVRPNEAYQAMAAVTTALALDADLGEQSVRLGEAYGLTGRTEKAREVLRGLEELSRERYVSPSAAACLVRAYEERARVNRT